MTSCNRGAARAGAIHHTPRLFSPSPLLRGGGRGEGQTSQQFLTRRYAPSPAAKGGDLSPQRGEKEGTVDGRTEAATQSSFARASRSALPITLTEDSAIAAAPTIGDSRMPNTG
jgi:hypothetical protein